MSDHRNANLELTMTRFIAAPADKVWKVVTNRIEQWRCEKPWRAAFDQLAELCETL